MGYDLVKLKDEIVIGGIYTIYYYEKTVGFESKSESHDFWELVYVDKGEGVATCEGKEFLLKQGDAVFHKPNQLHSLRASENTAPNFFLLTFKCRSKALDTIANEIITLGETKKSLLSKIIDESTMVFSTPLNERITEFKKNKDIPFGAEQMIKLYLTEFIISLVRKDVRRTRAVLEHHTEDNLFNIITDFMHNNISENLCFEDVVKYSNLSGSSLKRLFKKNCGMGVMDYYIKLKIDYAKKYIREKEYNLTQIANMLGYDSIHYFSNQFKSRTGMSPTEYKKTIL